MPRRLTHALLALTFLLTGEVWAIGLGDVRLDSALNEPLRAQIELLSATPEELANLEVALASQDTFNRYGLDRPFYLQNIEFEIVQSGRTDGNYILATSALPMTEPFLTFLVEATWSRGRLLREYTVLLDPPTFAPPTAAQSAPPVTAPQRSTSTDSGRIEPAPAPTATDSGRIERAPAPRPAPKPQPVRDDTPYDRAAGGDYVVRRGDSLWAIASSMRPDSRLSMNQTMLAIYEANPQAFGGNINMLRADARLRIPSADEIYRIDRGEALSEVQRQYSAWDTSPGAATTPAAPAETRPSLTLVPPDEEPVGVGIGQEAAVSAEPATREQQILDRIGELEAADVPVQRSLIEIRDNELASLRQELANIRGEVYEPIDDVYAEDDPFVEDAAGEEMADEEIPDFDETAADDEAPAVDEAAEAEPVDTTTVVTRRADEPSFVDLLLGWATSIWTIVGAAVLVAIGVLFWFMRRGAGDGADAWGRPLDDDEVRAGAEDTHSKTATMAAPTREDESFVVVEQDPAIRLPSDTVEVKAAPSIDTSGDTGQFASIEDTFSSDTAINLDQSDPIAEADFHMAYGLYDQAADLINGALAIEPERQDLLTKLCEIYFVWGNRDSFVDAAGRLQKLSGGASADWDKIVIMGQQIAGDDSMFAGAGVTGVTREVDLAFGAADADDTGILDMDFDTAVGGDNVVDLAAGSDDFLFGDDDTLEASSDATGEMPTMEQPAVDQTGEVPTMEQPVVDQTGEMPTMEQPVVDQTGELPTMEQPVVDQTGEMPTMEQPAVDSTGEMPAADTTVETPTIEQQLEGFDGTSELPALDATLDQAIESSGQASDATAEIELDDLGLDLGGLGEDDVTELASLDDLDSTGTREMLADATDATSENPALDPSATGLQPSLDPDASSLLQGLNLEDPSASGMRLAPDETGQNPLLDTVDDTIDESLRDATGRTQVLSDDQTAEIGIHDKLLGEEEATLLAPSMGDDDFDFAKTEQLSPNQFVGGRDPGQTGELPSIGATDVDLDLDDLTAALEVNEFTGDTVQQPADDATVEQLGPAAVPEDDMETQEMSPQELSDDLQEARTMTEVGTKLDLARAYVDMGDPAGARSILEEVLDEGDAGQRQQAQQLLDSLPT